MKRNLEIRGTTNEEVLIAYFAEKSTRTSSLCLWSYYPMLQKTLFLREKIDMSRGGILFLSIRYEAINDKDENINFRCERKRRSHFIGTDILSL